MPDSWLATEKPVCLSDFGCRSVGGQQKNQSLKEGVICYGRRNLPFKFVKISLDIRFQPTHLTKGDTFFCNLVLVHTFIFQPTHPTKGDTVNMTPNKYEIAISIHSSRVGRYEDSVLIEVLATGISIHSSRVGRYSNTAQKYVITILQYYQKSAVFLICCPRKIKSSRTHRRKQFISRCESPRISM